MSIAQPGLGILALLALAWGLSEDRWRVRPLQVLGALLAQLGLAALTLRVEPVRRFFLAASDAIGALKAATTAGTSFVFGYAGGAPPPFAVLPGHSTFIFGLQALPMVMVVSALAMLLFHWRILPTLVRGASWFLRRTLRIGGALGVCAAAKVFLGQSEAPLLIRPYLPRLTRSELFTVMTLGMATTSAAVMVIYASILEGVVEHPIGHILTASLISLPGAVAISRLVIPQQGADTDGTLAAPYRFSGAMEAVAQGANDGLKLFLNILAMLIVTLALVSLCNAALGHVEVGAAALSLQRIFGWALAPVAWLMGIPWAEAPVAAQLLGTKVALNEVMAFLDLAGEAGRPLGAHARLIMTYALCGFANFASIGIQIGGIGTMVPERRAEIISLGLRSLIAGTLTNCLSATIVGLLSP